MSPRTGRPTSNPKTERLEIRLTQEQLNTLNQCTQNLGVTKTVVLLLGLGLVKEGLDISPDVIYRKISDLTDLQQIGSRINRRKE